MELIESRGVVLFRSCKIEPDDVVIEVGAKIGEFTVAAAQIGKKSIHVSPTRRSLLISQ